MPKLVIIGLDGAPFDLIKDLSQKGVIPNLKDLIQRYRSASIYSTLPEISSVAWSAIITGENPAAFGIFGFTDIIPSGYKIFFPKFTDLKIKPFWKEREDLFSVIANVPSTYPAQALNGILISGFVSYDLNEAVYPKDLLGRLKKMDYRIDVDSQKAHKSIKAFIEDMDKTLAARERLLDYLRDLKWDVFMFVFTETDRLFHFLWDAYEEKGHQYHNYFMDLLNRLDGIIGRMVKNLSEEDSLIILSDHGFERLKKDCFVNFYLKEKGFLQKDARFEDMQISIDNSTKAFSLDPARIYINSDKKEEIIKELKGLFLSWEIDGAKVISKIYHRDEIYQGPHKDNSPDLVLVPNQGFNLKSSFNADILYGDGRPFKGKHTYDGAFMITNLDIEFSKDFSVIDAGRAIKERFLSL